MFIFIIQLYNHFRYRFALARTGLLFALRSTCMRICSDQPCIVLLTEKDVWIRVNGKEPISLKANHMALLNCENNIIDVSSLNNTLVAHISHDIIKDYLRFLNKISRKYQYGNVALRPYSPCHA